MHPVVSSRARAGNFVRGEELGGGVLTAKGQTTAYTMMKCFATLLFHRLSPNYIRLEDADPVTAVPCIRFRRVSSSAHLCSGYGYGSLSSPVHGHGTTPGQPYDATEPRRPGVSGSGAGSARHLMGGSPTQLANVRNGGSGNEAFAFGGGGGSRGHGALYGGASGVGLGVRDLPYAEWHPCISVLFADICGFTQISNKVGNLLENGWNASVFPCVLNSCAALFGRWGLSRRAPAPWSLRRRMTQAGTIHPPPPADFICRPTA